MLPLLTSVTAVSEGEVMLACSSITSATRCPDAALCVSMTNTMESIMSDIRIDMT